LTDPLFGRAANMGDGVDDSAGSSMRTPLLDTSRSMMLGWCSDLGSSWISAVAMNQPFGSAVVQRAAAKLCALRAATSMVRLVTSTLRKMLDRWASTVRREM
jgi:hypothetical protein